MDLLEVYLSYITDKGVEIVKEQVYLDTAIEVSQYGRAIIHFYDVIDKWVLALPGSIALLSDSTPKNFDYWEPLVDQELRHSKMLKKLGLLTRCSVSCKIMLKNGLRVHTFNSFLSRNIYSLAEEDVYALQAETIIPIRYHGEIPVQIRKGNIEDFADPLSYLLLVQPLLWDIRILAENGYTLTNYVLIKYNDKGKEKVVIRLLCRGIDLMDVSHNRYKQIDYIEALDPLKNFLINFIPNISQAPMMKRTDSNFVKELVKDIVSYYSEYVEALEYKDAFGSIARLNKSHAFINCELTGKEPKISDDPEERTIQLLKATERSAQSKKYIVDLFYRGVNIFYKNGEILVNSVKNGGDYMLRLMSLTPGRLTSFLSYTNTADNLFLFIIDAKRNRYDASSQYNAFKYVLAHDNRKGKENSVSYKKLIKQVRYYPDLIRIYINYGGPMYETLIEK